MNCATGVNDASTEATTDVGALINSITNAKNPNTNGYGGLIQLGDGYFAEVTTIDMNPLCLSACYGTWNLFGAGMGVAYGPPVNGTVIVAKTNGMTMIECTATPGPTANTLQGETFEHFGLEGNSLASVGIDCRGSEPGFFATHIERVRIRDGGHNPPLTFTGMKMDGNEDSELVYPVFDTNCCSVAIEWAALIGEPQLIGVDSTGNGVDLLTCGMHVHITGGNLGTVKISTSITGYTTNWCATGVGDLEVTGGDWTNEGTALSYASSRVNLNGATIDQLSVTDTAITLNGQNPTFMIAGSGTIVNSNWCGDAILVTGGGTWTTGSPTLTHQATCGTLSGTAGYGNYITGTITGFPFTVTGSSW